MKTMNYLGLALLIGATASMTAACGDDDETTGPTTSSSASTGGGGMGTGGMGTGGDGTGGGVTTPDCVSYCAQIDTNCAGADKQYVSTDSCEAVCANMDLGTKGITADATGENTVGCRTYHSGTPAEGEPAVHCIHGGPAGAGQCGSSCESFCSLNEAVCGFGAMGNNQFADSAACMTACMGMDMTDTYDASDVSADAVGADNSFSCYLYHLTVAAGDGMASAHCGHTNPATMPGPCYMTP